MRAFLLSFPSIVPRRQISKSCADKSLVYDKGDKKGEVCVSILVGRSYPTEIIAEYPYSTSQEMTNGATRTPERDGYPSTLSRVSYVIVCDRSPT